VLTGGARSARFPHVTAAQDIALAPRVVHGLPAVVAADRLP